MAPFFLALLALVPRGVFAAAADASPSAGRAFLSKMGQSDTEAQDNTTETGVNTTAQEPSCSWSTETEFVQGMTPKPYVIYRGLDFAFKSCHDNDDGKLSSSFSSREEAVKWCADECAQGSSRFWCPNTCRTWTVHTHRFLTGFWAHCYLHDEWLCDDASQFHAKSIGHDIYSCALNPEPESMGCGPTPHAQVVEP